MKSSKLKIGGIYQYCMYRQRTIYNDWWFDAKIRPEELGELNSGDSFVLLGVDPISVSNCRIKLLSSQGIIGWVVLSYSSITPAKKNA